MGMAETSTAEIALAILGGLAGLLTIYTGVIFWSVKSQIVSLKSYHQENSKDLREHLDERLDRVSAKLDEHEKRIHNQEINQLKLRNEVLENMRTSYVRHTDIQDIKEQMRSIFDRLNDITRGLRK